MQKELELTCSQVSGSQSGREGLEYYADVPAQTVLRRIEDAVISLLQSLNAGESPSLHISRPQQNLRIDPVSGQLGLDPHYSSESVYSLSSKRSGPMLVRILKVLETVYALLLRGERITKRELFYMSEGLFGTQQCSDAAVALTSALLKVPRSCLNIIANSRGLVTGALSYTEAGITTTVGRRLLRIPEVLDHIDHFAADADFILIVEKEAVANKLLEENYSEEKRAIVITGAGYPDYHTRVFTKRLAEEHRDMPVFVLTDADPHGFEIMTVYLFGSQSLAGEGIHTALPSALWLGVHFAEVWGSAEGALPLSAAERRKTELLLDAPQLASAAEGSRFAHWRSQLLSMLSNSAKFEIESLYQREGQNLSQYLDWKLDQQLWL